MTILHISDTHNLHHKITSPLISKADILIHSGDITNNGTEREVLDFLNWFISLPNAHKIFVTGNHDTCLLDAERIDDLPENVHFLQDSSVSIGGTTFFGLGYSHNEMLIPGGIDFLITHEPPIMILDKSSGVHWGNIKIRNRVQEIKPKYHLFGHAHEGYGIKKIGSTFYSNATLMNDKMELVNEPRRFYILFENLKIESEDEEYNLTFIYGFDDEELGSIFFTQTDALIVQCFSHSTHEKLKTLIQNEFPHGIETLGVAIFLKIHRETCFEKIIEVIEKLKTIN